MKYLIIIFCIAGSLNVKAQQLQTSSFYDLQGVFHNPAMAGMGTTSFIGATYRNQWNNLSGAPKTMTVFGSHKLQNHNFGIAGYLYNDKTGPTSRTGLNASFSKIIPTTGKGSFSLGIETKFQQYALNRSKLSATLGADPALGTSDNKFKFDAGFGVAYTNDKLQFGVSISQLVQTKLNFYSGNLTTSEEAKLYRHIYLHGSYKLNFDPNTTFTPNFLAIALPNAPTEFQTSVRVEHNKVFWWSLGLRLKQSIMASAGVNINKNFTIGYAFDNYNDNSVLFRNGGSAHEFLVRFNLNNGSTK